MDLSLFISVAFLHLIAVISPGPDFFFILNKSFTSNFRQSLLSSLGIGCGIILHCLGSILIITFFESYLSNTYLILGTLGALYFIYIGYSGIRNKSSNNIENKNNNDIKTSLNHFLDGFYVNISNVKAFIFFVSIFSGMMVGLELPFKFMMSLYLSFATTLWFSFISFNLNVSKKYLLNERIQNIITKVSSFLMILIGISILYQIWNDII